MSKVGDLPKIQKAQCFQRCSGRFVKNSQKVSKHPKGAFRARKMLEMFEYSVLGNTRALFSNLGLLLSQTQFALDITSKIGYSAIFSNLDLFFSGMQLTSDIM